MPDYGPMQVFGCSAGSDITDLVCKHLSTPRGKAVVGRFKDGEPRIQIQDNVRGADVFLVNPTRSPRDWIELMLFGSALRDASAQRVTMIVPYLGHNRQERKTESREPYAAQDMIEVLKIARPNRVVLLDLHAPATAAAFRPTIPDHLYAAPVLIPVLRDMFNGSDFVVASPDAGGVARARKYAEMLRVSDLVVFHKHRLEAGKVSDEILMVGNVKGRDVLIVDDMIDSGGTLVAVSKMAKEAGARRIVAAAAHGLFSDGAISRLKRSPIDLTVVTDSVGVSYKAETENHIQVVSVSQLLANAIRRLHDGLSLSTLFFE